jgi:elongator complex protein 3
MANNRSSRAGGQNPEYSPEVLELAASALEEIEAGKDVFKAIRSYPLPDGAGFLSKHTLITAYRNQVESGVRDADRKLLARIRLKPMRTLSGVTTVTVLTKPYPCPGECIFCPSYEQMPVSYLPDEPGAMRALHHQYDPFDQVEARIDALYEIGHPTEKIELLILGGSWSAYPKDYQEWFIKRCFEAMNEEPAESLEQAQLVNEGAVHKNVGLVIETRPDLITADELLWLRKLGATKVQLGIQSLDNRILALNQRGHTLEEAEQGTAALRAAGFKIVVHWMPNLLGATLESDRKDFLKIWTHFAPDEIKIYPTQLLENTRLYEIWEAGEYHPYSSEELIELISDVKPGIPRYSRVNRVIRDIPSHNVVEGNKRTSLRQDVHRELKQRGTHCNCIRCREIRGQDVDTDNLEISDLRYEIHGFTEHFLSYDTPGDKLAGFLRLSLPGPDIYDLNLPELKETAMIREIHVYGQSLRVGYSSGGAAQHSGLGTSLLAEAEKIARQEGFKKIAVISAVGTRQYYLDRGYERGQYYLIKRL